MATDLASGQTPAFDSKDVLVARTATAAERLDSWKEIATHLRRTVRTVQRWERLYGLPVRRHAHTRGASVYAFAPELDRWWTDRRPILGDDTAPHGAGSLVGRSFSLERSARLRELSLRLRVELTLDQHHDSPLANDDLARALALACQGAVEHVERTLQRQGSCSCPERA
jgi:hypothetical protein